MSRIGNKAVSVPSGVTANIEGQTVKVKGPKGALQLVLSDDVIVTMDKGSVKIEPRGDGKRARSLWGTSRTLVSNLINGVTKGFEERLEINGVGYRAAVQGKSLNLQLGFSHDVNFKIPEGITIATPKPTEILITGVDKQKVGQVAAEIRGYRPPEPYKGKMWPSITISACAGTRRFTVRAWATSIGTPAKPPATSNSSMPMGSFCGPMKAT